MPHPQPVDCYDYDLAPHVTPKSSSKSYLSSLKSSEPSAQDLVPEDAEGRVGIKGEVSRRWRGKDLGKGYGDKSRRRWREVY